MAPNHGSKLVKLSVSDLLPFLDCERRGHTRFFTQRWVPPSRSQRLGSHLHDFAASVLDPSRGRPVIAQDLKEFEFLESELLRYLTPRPPFEVLSIEQPLEFELEPGVKILTRVDGLVDRSGVHDLQYKSLGKGKSVST